MDRELIDFDRGNVNIGTTVQIFNYLDNSWRAAVVEEVDLAEREILVTYDDDTQEWVGVDGRKICFPPVNMSDSSNTNRTQQRLSDSKGKKIHLTKLRSNLAKDRKSFASFSSFKKSHSNISAKSAKQSIAERKDMSKLSAGSGFLRLKFKTNNKNGKPSVTKVESIKKCKQKKKLVQNTIADSSQVESLHADVNLKEVTAKVAQSPLKEWKRDPCKLKIRISKNETKVVTSTDDSTSNADKVETPSFSTCNNEKKIKTLLPKRNVGEMSPGKVCSPDVPSPESPICVSTSLSPIYPTANGNPILNFSPSSSGYVCPKQDCKKQFRNENLLMMHIKHYHREYRNMLHSMPNVADLAYARTVGEQIGSPQANFLEKIAKLEEDKLNQPEDSDKEINFGHILTNEKTLIPENATEMNKSNNRKISQNKRLSASELPPKLPVLLAQLQGPPLVPSSISIEPDTVDVELSISQKKLSSISSPQLSEQSDSFVDSDEKTDGGKKSPTKKRRLSQLDSTDVINCTCGYGLEDGLMIQCDLCQCWQHGSCVGFENENDVPFNYTCETCQFSKRCHSSRRYSYVQNWLKEGIMPKFQFNGCDEQLRRKREKFLKQSHLCLCELIELKHAICTLQLKIQMLRQTPDHPKLYLWAKSWYDEIAEKEKEKNRTMSDVGPVPEDAINMVDCRKHLSEHINKEIEKADNLLHDIEEKIEKLEEPINEEGEGETNWNNEMEKYVCIVKQTFLMMLRDLTLLRVFKYCE